MRKFGKVLSIIFAVIALVSFSACGANDEKDEWDGVKVANNTLFQTMQVQSELVNPPTVVCDLDSKDAYDKLMSNESKPSSVILRLNDKYNVVDSQGEKLCSFQELYRNVLSVRIIPIIYVADDTEAQRAIKLFTERYDLLDAAVMSDDPSFVKTVRKAVPKIGGIIEFNELDDIHDAVRIANTNLASVAVIPQNIATAENVFYIQSRFKTVWVHPDDSQKRNLFDCINSGTYGLVSDDFMSVIDALGEYGERSATRMPFVVAHRGLPETYNENSVSGAKAAIAAGATHLEIDGYLTQDNRIAIMHDYTIERTSDGEGVIEDYELDELQKFNLDLFQPKEPIPSLDDILQAMKGSNIVLLFEIKSQKVEIVNALKTVLETFGMEKQVVVLTNHLKILSAMARTLPEIPTAFLTAISEDTLDGTLATLRSFNSVYSAPFDGVTPDMNAKMRDRGIVGWYWTYDTVADMKSAVSAGYTGLTTNVADKFVKETATKYVRIKGDGNVTIAPTADKEIALIGITYQNTQEKITGKVFYVENLGDKYAVIVSYSTAESRTDALILYTQIYYIKKSEKRLKDFLDI